MVLERQKYVVKVINAFLFILPYFFLLPSPTYSQQFLSDEWVRVTAEGGNIQCLEISAWDSTLVFAGVGGQGIWSYDRVQETWHEMNNGIPLLDDTGFYVNNYYGVKRHSGHSISTAAWASDVIWALNGGKLYWR